MTVWVGGDVITSAWLNTVEKVLALGTYDATANPRLTFAPNSNFDLIGGQVANNLRLNGSISVGANKYYAWLDARTLTSTITSGTGVPYAAILTYDHQVTSIASGAGAYGIIGAVVGNGGAGKISSIYGRSSVGAAFTGIAVAGTFAITLDATPAGGANLLNLEMDATGAYQVATGILFNSNSAGTGSLGTAIAIDSSVTIGSSVLTWLQRAGSTAPFLIEYNSSSVKLFEVDYLGNINFKVTGPAAGQLITGDMTNATLASRLMFQTITANSTTSLGIRPSGAGTAGVLALYNGSDPDNAGRLNISGNTAAHTLNSLKSGTGTVLGIGIQINSVTQMNFKANTDLVIGQAPVATTDTTGHHYIQAVAGAVTGVPTTYAGYVPIRYDISNNFLYVYNGGWKKSTVYA